MTAWYHNIHRAYLLDFQMPDSADQMPLGQPPNLRHVDPQRIVNQLHQAGVQALYTHAKDNQGNCYYNTQFGHKHSGIGDRDLMAEFSLACRAVGMTLLFYVQMSRERRANREPMYAARREDGSPLVMVSDKPLQPSLEERPVICLNGPGREYIKNIVGELADKYDFDGYWLDCFAWWGLHNPCYCSYCRDKYRMDRGVPLPRADDKTSPAWRQYYLWRMNLNNLILEEIRQTIRAVNPHLTITHNPLYHTAYIDFGEAGSDDYMSHEFHFDEGYGYLSLTCRQNDALRPNQPFEIETWRFANRLRGERPMLRGYQVRPVVQLFTEMATVLANGGFTQYYDQINPDGTLDPFSIQVMKEAFEELRCREPYIDRSLLRLEYASLVWSARNQALAPTPWQQSHLHELEGFHLALTESHTTHRLITDHDLAQQRLGNPRVLVLPNLMLMSAQQVQAVRQFVEQGGGLVASFRTSLCDVEGNSLSQFQLADVLGADYLEMFGYSYGFMRFDEQHELTHRIPLGFPITLWDKYQTKVRPHHNSTTLGRLVHPMRGMHMGNPPQEITPYPAMVMHRMGKGRVVYLPQQLGEAYQDYGHPDLRQLLVNAVRWAAGSQPAIQLKAPGTVEMVAWGTPEGRRVIHLVNRTSAGPMRTKGSVITECIPVHDLRVILSHSAATAIRQPDNQPLSINQTRHGWEITLDRLDIHTMVILEP